MITGIFRDLGAALGIDAQALAWQDQARCAEVGADLWHPEKGERTGMAKAICRGCPVRAECLEYALDINDQHGIYGGKTVRERDRIRRARREAASERTAA